jgi:transcription-repair coupling factor (superfamily II helicase)
MIDPDTMETGLVDHLAEDPRINAVARALRAGEPRFLGGLWGSSAALAAGLLIRAVNRHAVFVTARLQEAEEVVEDLSTFGLTDQEPLLLPPLATARRGDPRFDPEAYSARQVVLRELHMHPAPRTIVAPVRALVGPMVPREQFEGAQVRVRPGEKLDPAAFLRHLLAREFIRVPQVEGPGEVALRGDVLDVFAWGARHPVRIELFDEEVEEIREFDPATQRSVARVTMVRFPAVRTADFQRVGAAAIQTFLDFLPPGSLLFLREVEQLMERVAGVRGIEQALFAGETGAVRVRMAALPMPAGAGVINFRTASVEALGQTPTWPSSLSLGATLDTIQRLLGRNRLVYVHSPSETEQARFAEIVAERLPEVRPRIRFATGRLAQGFQLREAEVAALSHHEFLA